MSSIKWFKGFEWTGHSVGYCPSLKAYQKFFGKECYWHSDGDRWVAKTEMNFLDDELKYVILVFFNPKFIAKDAHAFVSTLVHESIHVVDFIAENLGMDLCTETRAYLTQHTYNELMRTVDFENQIVDFKGDDHNGKRLEAEEGGSGGVQQAQEDSGPS